MRPFVRSWLKEEPRLNDMLATFLQYFGVIYGLLLGLLAVATYQNRLGGPPGHGTMVPALR